MTEITFLSFLEIFNKSYLSEKCVIKRINCVEYLKIHELGKKTVKTHSK